ncbi:DUF4139 domain-containing protein [Paenisporosarcina sp.]|uniref:DUF4139 domain-containing protein n=1 Tax=Paenisporosarcina sp. TaxID=1932001 RepID=UPI003C72F095
MPTNIPSSLTKDLALTIYNDGFALVQEIRSIPPLSDDHIVYYTDVPERIESNSVQVKGLKVTELTYEYDLMDRMKLLEKYVGHEIRLVNKKTGEEKTYLLLDVQNGLVLADMVTREIVLDAEGEIRLPDGPEEVMLKPTLVWRFKEQTAEDVRVTYLTRGLSWDADYVAQIRENDFDLTGWVTMTNNSGMTFDEAKVKLMAGTVSRATMLRQKTMAFEQNVSDEPERQAFGEYYLYTLPERLTLNNRQQKQVQLFSAYQIKSQTVYEVDAYSDHPTVYFTFLNDAANGLGFPLPRGRFKLYKENPKDGSSEFIGEDYIPHTAVGELVRIKSGEAFDVTVESDVVAEYKKDGYEYEEVVYLIRNQKDQPIELIINHSTSYGIFDVVESTHTWKRKDDDIQIFVPVPAKSEVKVAFTIRYDRRQDVKVN